MARVELFHTDTFEMKYCVFGQGKQVFIMLPGISLQSVLDSADAIEQAYQPLVEDCTIYVMEDRLTITEEYTLQDAVEDLHLFFQQLHLHDVCLFGVSRGSMIAQLYALSYPENVSKIILASSSSRITPFAQDIFHHWMTLAKEKKVEELIFDFAGHVYPETVLKQFHDTFLAMIPTVTSDVLKRFIIICKTMYHFDVWDQLLDIQCPIFLIANQDDKVFPYEETKKTVSLLKAKESFQYYIYDGYGHASYDLAPDYKERLRSFLRT